MKKKTKKNIKIVAGLGVGILATYLIVKNIPNVGKTSKKTMGIEDVREIDIQTYGIADDMIEV